MTEFGPPIRLAAQYAVGARRNPPTKREIEVFLTIVETTTTAAAAAKLGIGPDAVRKRLASLYERIGAENRPHAAWLLWSVLGEQYRLPLVAGCQRIAA